MHYTRDDDDEKAHRYNIGAEVVDGDEGIYLSLLLLLLFYEYKGQLSHK